MKRDGMLRAQHGQIDSKGQLGWQVMDPGSCLGRGWRLAVVRVSSKMDIR